MAPPNTSNSVGDMFLMVKGAQHGLIKGESQDKSHKDEIEVLAWSWGMQGKAHLSGGGSTGKASMHDLKITKRVDSSSTALMLALRTNEPITKAVLTLRKAGKTQLEYMKITIEQARVMSLMIDGGSESNGSGVGGAGELERITFSFNKIEVEYVPQDKDGFAKGGMKFEDQWSGQQ